MDQEHSRLVNCLSTLNWKIPLALSLLTVGYILFEQVLIQGHSPVAPHVVRTCLVVGLVGPVLLWAILRLAVKAVTRDADAHCALAVLSSIGEITSQSRDLEEVLGAALKKTVELMGLEAAGIRLLEDKKLVLKAHYGLSPHFVSEEETIPLDYCMCGVCAQRGEIMVVEDLAANPPLANSLCAREGFRSTISIPMRAKGQMMGILHVSNRRKSNFTLRDQQLLTLVGDRLGAAIENIQSYQVAYRRAVSLEAASLVGQRVTNLLDPDALLSEVVKLIQEKFGYYHVHILLVDEETGHLVLKEASGPGAESLKAHGLRLRIGQEGITGWVAHTGQAWLCNDVTQESHYYATELVPETKAEMAVPLRVSNRIIGVLDVQSNQRHAFSQEDVTVLQILGDQVAIAIENARLFQEAKIRYAAMLSLHETSLGIISQADMSKLLGDLLRRGAILLGAQASCLFMYDAKHELIYNMANYNTWRDWNGVTLRPGEGIAGQVILTGEPLIVNNYETWPWRATAFAGAPHTKGVGVPLKWQGQTIGAIIVLNETHSRSFDHKDVWLLSLFADLAAIAIKNADLYGQVKELNQALERKVEEKTQELILAQQALAAKVEQLRSLAAKTMQVQEEERARIARDMHDGVIQLITACQYELQAVKVALESGSSTVAKEKLTHVHEVLEETEQRIREAIYDLHPLTLSAAGLVPALRQYASDFQGLSGITCDVHVIGSPCQLPPPTEVAIFRVVEESLHNIMLHANARAASVTIDFQPDTVHVTVQDDGHGFDYDQWAKKSNTRNLGLVGMEERVRSLGGKSNVWSSPGKGTRVDIWLPIQPIGNTQKPEGVGNPKGRKQRQPQVRS